MKKYIPFSNATEAEQWMNNNCEICTTSKNCSAKRNIELGFIIGEITIAAANFIGISRKFINSNYITLNIECQNKDKRIVKKCKKIENTLKLF